VNELSGGDRRRAVKTSVETREEGSVLIGGGQCRPEEGSFLTGRSANKSETWRDETE
jgi:hypothetical protein